MDRMGIKKYDNPSVRPISIQRALYYIVLVALIPAVFVIIVSGDQQARQWEDIVKRESLNQANSIAALQYSITESTRQMLATLAHLPEFRAMDAASMTPILKNLHSQNQAYLNFAVIDGQGSVVASSLLEPGISLKGRPHVEGVLRTAEFSPGSYIVGLIENAPSFSYAYPVFSPSGILVGAITATYKLSSYTEYMKEIARSHNTILGIVDRYGTRLYYYSSEGTNPVGKPIKYEIWDRMQRGPEQEVFLSVGSDSVKRYYGYKKLRTAPDQDPYLYVVYGIPYAEVTSKVLPILYQELGLVVIIMLAAFGITRLLYTYLFGRRLQSIVALTEQIQQGNTAPIELPPDQTPDLGRIKKALLSLMKNLEIQKKAKQAYETELEKAIQDKNMLIKEIHHRVKNDFQLIQSLVHLQSESGEDINSFREAIESRIASMSLVHQMLYETEHQGLIDLGSYGQKIMELLISIKDIFAPIRLEVTADPIQISLDKAITFGLLLNELVMNSLKHGLDSERPPVFSLGLRKNQDQVEFTFKDNGNGLPPNFSPATSKGLGMQLALALAEQLGGTLRWENAGGACFYVDFPLTHKT